MFALGLGTSSSSSFIPLDAPQIRPYWLTTITLKASCFYPFLAIPLTKSKKLEQFARECWQRRQNKNRIRQVGQDILGYCCREVYANFMFARLRTLLRTSSATSALYLCLPLQ